MRVLTFILSPVIRLGLRNPRKKEREKERNFPPPGSVSLRSVSILEQIELQAKLLNYFLGSNKSNINQKPASRISQLSGRENGSIFLHTNFESPPLEVGLNAQKQREWHRRGPHTFPKEDFSPNKTQV